MARLSKTRELYLTLQQRVPGFVSLAPRTRHPVHVERNGRDRGQVEYVWRQVGPDFHLAAIDRDTWEVISSTPVSM